MKTYTVKAAILLAFSLILVSCGGGGGTSALTPATSFSATAGNAQVILTWKNPTTGLDKLVLLRKPTPIFH